MELQMNRLLVIKALEDKIAELKAKKIKDASLAVLKQEQKEYRAQVADKLKKINKLVKKVLKAKTIEEHNAASEFLVEIYGPEELDDPNYNKRTVAREVERIQRTLKLLSLSSDTTVSSNVISSIEDLLNDEET